MKKLIITLVLGGILIGAVYATAASLTLTTNDIGAGQATIAAVPNVDAIDWILRPTDSSVADKAALTLSANSATADTINFQILTDGGDSGCTDGNETAVFTIAGTGAAGGTAKTFFLTAVAGTPSIVTDGDGTISVVDIDCINVTIEQ